MKLGRVEKQPNETESYTITYEDDLTAGDFIQSVVLVSIDPPAPLSDPLDPLSPPDPNWLVVDQIFVFTPRVKFLASKGISGSTYKATFRVTTGDNRILEDEVIIKVKEL